jgi:hypothetical protein
MRIIAKNVAYTGKAHWHIGTVECLTVVKAGKLIVPMVQLMKAYGDVDV